MIKYTYTKNIFAFYLLNDSEVKMPVSDWHQLESEHLSQLAILYELQDNGLANYTADTCEIDIVNILRLNDIDRQILELPDRYPYEIFIESEGELQDNSFRFKYGFFDFAPNGTRLKAERKGAMVFVGENEYLLSENQYLICESIDEFNCESGNKKKNTFNLNLEKLHEIKALSKEDGLTLELFLRNQELYIPDKIKLDIDYKNGFLEIIPSVKIDNAIGFTRTFDKKTLVDNVYSVSDNDGCRTRIIISENQKKELEKIKQKRKISDKKIIKEIIEHPEYFFNGEEVDYTVLFSKRVKEIGLYSPRFYPFASPYKSQWIPGIVIKDKVDGEKRIYFKTPEKLSDFIDQKEKAVKENKQTVPWENYEIPVEEAEKLIKVAKKQFESPNEPLKKDDKKEYEVLIIKENAEITEFSDGNEPPEILKHKFSEIRNLNIGIELKEHQKEGISWLQSLLQQDFAGGLLADDMGLGKTLQLLYFIEWHSQTYDENKPYLIVAPVSLLENWENEYKKFFSPQNLPLLRLTGDLLTKEVDTIKNMADAESLQFKQIILTNYETVRSYQISLGMVDFAVIALDEAQKIKTPGTLITNACKALKADFKIAMTGTPVENTLVDIWCIIDFAVPGLLGNAKEFAAQYQKPLKDENTDIKSLTEKLRNSIGVFIKRRLKSDVAKDLPKKHDNERSRIKKVMPPIQFERYKQEIELANNESLTGIDGRNQKLKSLWAVRDISDHPYLLDSQILKFSTDDLIASSSKLQTTIGLLTEIKYKTEKVIIFADRRETQKMLQKVVYDTFSIFPSIINGDTPTTRQQEGKSKISRQQTIDRFQAEEGFNVIIMSPIAAGVGLNVTDANHIIHYSRHWNPAKEEQATDRAYRIGQKKDVFVHYPMAVFPDEMKDEEGKKLKSFDEILDTLLFNKKMLANNALFPTEQAEVSPDEIFSNIFGAKTDSKIVKLTLLDVDLLRPNLFEAFIAALYKKQGFEIYLTPNSNDKGADVVALKEGENYLIQAKQTKSAVGNDAIQEICTAKKYYENRFKEKFNLLTITNNDYSSSANILAKSNDIRLLNRDDLEKLINQYDVTSPDMNKIESQRLTKV